MCIAFDEFEQPVVSGTMQVRSLQRHLPAGWLTSDRHNNMAGYTRYTRHRRSGQIRADQPRAAACSVSHPAVCRETGTGSGSLSCLSNHCRLVLRCNCADWLFASRMIDGFLPGRPGQVSLMMNGLLDKASPLRFYTIYICTALPLHCVQII